MMIMARQLAHSQRAGPPRLITGLRTVLKMPASMIATCEQASFADHWPRRCLCNPSCIPTPRAPMP
jgi:hypothetical protein